MPGKIAIMPCNGVGQAVATITRESAYKIHSSRPKETLLLSSPEVAADKQDSISIAKTHKIIVIEGCKERCSAYMLNEKGIKNIAEIFVPAVCANKKLSIAEENRACLGKKGTKIVKEIVRIALQIIDK